MSRSSEHVDDLLDGLVGTVIGGFEAAVWSMLRIGTVVEAAVGERSAQALMEEQEQQCDLDTFRGEAVSVAGTVTLDQAVALEFAQIVAELVQAVSCSERSKVVRTAWWICLAVQPPTWVPPCRRTSKRRMTRVSWILMPG